MVKKYRKVSVMFSLTDAGYNALQIPKVKIMVSQLFFNGCNGTNKLLKDSLKLFFPGKSFYLR